MTKTLRIGLIGSGFMGRAHAQAFRAAAFTFDLPAEPELDCIADIDEQRAAQAALSLGFRRSTGDWRKVVTDPAIDLVAIATPNILHAPIALAAMEAGKAVYCEKPLAARFEDSEQMMRAATARGVANGVGFTYLHNPMIQFARELVASGEIGEITGFRGVHAEDFMADPEAPFNWRCEPENAGGALADIGSHIVSLALHLAGGIESVSGALSTIHTHRRGRDGVERLVNVDDQMDAVVRFKNGATGVLAASWIASGRKMGLAFELTGTRGAISFTQERLNELQLFRAHGPSHSRGFVRIEAGVSHGDYAAFCPASGHQLGYNDLKTIEVKEMIHAIHGLPSLNKDFRFGLDVERVAEAIRTSHHSQTWANVA
ncbi:MAG: gfo/Idh/MocA family oxidoreductase [Alphaproteobacteria bacterium]|nr:gfo/Idh/MocA family oxidoreductase [Alphaproteobacteria bacterium]